MNRHLELHIEALEERVKRLEKMLVTANRIKLSEPDKNDENTTISLIIGLEDNLPIFRLEKTRTTTKTINNNFLNFEHER